MHPCGTGLHPVACLLSVSGAFGKCGEEGELLDPSLLSLWTSLVDSLR